MAVRRPFKIDGSGGIQEMTDADMLWLRWKIAQAFVDDDDTGTLAVTTTNTAPATGYTDIGTMTDRARSQGARDTNIGNMWGVGPTTSNVNAPGNASSVVYRFWQNRNNLTQTPTTAALNEGPLVANAGDYADLVPMSNGGAQDVYDTVIDDVYTDIRDGNVNGGYQLSSSASITGWTLISTLQNRRVTVGSTSGPANITSNRRRLFQRTGISEPTAIRPVRFDTAGGIIEMDDAEIEAFFMPYFRNRHTEGGRGQYFASSTSGTNVGTYSDTTYTGTSSTITHVTSHTYRRAVQTLDTDTYYLRRSW